VVLLTNELSKAKSYVKLAEQQYDGLKNSIRTLQEDNDELQKDSRDYEPRLVTDKGKLVNEMNGLTDIIEGLKKHLPW
jgi:autophagy-related protein 16